MRLGKFTALGLTSALSIVLISVVGGVTSRGEQFPRSHQTSAIAAIDPSQPQLDAADSLSSTIFLNAAPQDRQVFLPGVNIKLTPPGTTIYTGELSVVLNGRRSLCREENPMP